MPNGYILLHRKLQDNALWQMPREFSKAEAWIDILMEVQWKDEDEVVIGDTVIEVKRGQSVKSQRTWGRRWKWSESRVRRFFKTLKKLKMIEVETVAKTTHLTICNYDEYQKPRRDSDGNSAGSRRDDEPIPATDNKGNKRKKSLVRNNPPGIEEVAAYCGGRLNGIDAEEFLSHYEANGWVQGKNQTDIRSWKQAVVTWEKKGRFKFRDTEYGYMGPTAQDAKQIEEHHKKLNGERCKHDVLAMLKAEETSGGAARFALESTWSGFEGWVKRAEEIVTCKK